MTAWRWAIGLALLGLPGLALPGGAAEVRAALGMERDDNPFEETGAGRGGWVSRLYVSASGSLLDRPRWRAKVQHQGGIKRFWASDRQTPGAHGDVVTNDLEVSTQVRAARGLALSGRGNLKVKGVSRAPSEEGYLRGTAEGTAAVSLGGGFSCAARYLRGGDDSRAATLPNASLHEAGGEVTYGRSRRVQGRAGATWRRLGYGRPALGRLPDGGVTTLGVGQSDRLREVWAGVQVYRGALVHATYAFLSNRSNSFGYGFRAHRFHALVTRHLGGEVDGQVYLTFQARRYTDPLTPLPGARSEVDEYEQTVTIFKLSRQVTPRWGVSAQYGRFRNGARGSAGFYRKHVYAFSVDTSL